MADEKRFVDLQKRLDEWRRLMNACFPNFPCQDFYHFILNTPTVDAVEVVRCKECWKSAEGLCSYRFKNVPGKDFCGDGERKDNG